LGRVNGNKEQRVRYPPALFRNEFPFFVEGIYTVLFVWGQKESVAEWFEEGLCFVYGSVFVSVVEDVKCICRLWVIVFYVPFMVLVP